MKKTYTNKDFIIQKESLEANASDVFQNKFDITWAMDDPEISGFQLPNKNIEELAPDEDHPHGFSPTNPWFLAHKVGYRCWDRIPAEQFEKPYPKIPKMEVIYQYNNEYFRCDDFTVEHKTTHILFGGCSDTEGVGDNIEHSWAYRVWKEFNDQDPDVGFYSIARAGFGWQKIISHFQIYVNKYGFPQYFFVLMPNIGRMYQWLEDKTHFRYFQAYPGAYEIDEITGDLSINNNKLKKDESIVKSNALTVEQYMKALIDFIISWKLFEEYCERNGTKILWTTWNGHDAINFINTNFSNNFFNIRNDEKLQEYIKKLRPDGKLIKNDLRLRDGHSGHLITSYWAKEFLSEIYKLGWLRNDNQENIP